MEMAWPIIAYHNFDGGYPFNNKEHAYLTYHREDNTPTEEGLFKYEYEIVFLKRRFLRRSIKYRLGKLTFLFEKSGEKKIVHQVHIDACGRPMGFQSLKKVLESYYGDGSVSLKFIDSEPRIW